MKQEIRLSKRLELVTEFAGGGRCAADMGTDHGYVPIALVLRGLVDRAIAMDVRPGPLERAREHIRRYGLEGQIETRLSDGAGALAAGEADTFIAAGMGGELVIHILETGRALWEGGGRWILSPQSEPEKVRAFLEREGFLICREAMTQEDGKYYTVMEAARQEKGPAAPMTPAQLRYGPRLLENRDPVLAEFLKKEKKTVCGILAGLEGQTGSSAGERRKEMEQRRKEIQEAEDELQRMDGAPGEAGASGMCL